MAYYESDYYDDFDEDFDDDFDDTLVDDYEDAIGEDYEDAIIEDYDEGDDDDDRRSRRKARRTGRRRRRMQKRAARKARRNPPPRKAAPPPAVKPKEVKQAFNMVQYDVDRLKRASNISNDNALISALSILVNSAELKTEKVNVIKVDKDGKTVYIDKEGKIPATVEVLTTAKINDKILQQLLVLGTAYFSARGKIPRYAPFLLLGVLSIFPNLFANVNLGLENQSTTPADAKPGDLKFDIKSVIVLGALGFMLLGKKK